MEGLYRLKVLLRSKISASLGYPESFSRKGLKLAQNQLKISLKSAKSIMVGECGGDFWERWEILQRWDNRRVWKILRRWENHGGWEILQICDNRWRHEILRKDKRYPANAECHPVNGDSTLSVLSGNQITRRARKNRFDQ